MIQFFDRNFFEIYKTKNSYPTPLSKTVAIQEGEKIMLNVNYEELNNAGLEMIQDEKRLLQALELCIDEIYFHNKNLTKKQYYAACNLKDILHALSTDEAPEEVTTDYENGMPF